MSWVSYTCSENGCPDEGVLNLGLELCQVLMEIVTLNFISLEFLKLGKCKQSDLLKDP